MKTFKDRIYPSTAQETQLHQQLELCRWVYNKTLETRKNADEQQGGPVSYYATKKMLPAWKAQKPALGKVNAQVLQDVVMRVDLAGKAYFRRVKSAAEEPGVPAPKGYPRGKGYGRYDSMGFPQYGAHGCVRRVGNQLTLSKIGRIKVKLHRALDGTPKTVCIRRSSSGKWFATIACACAEKPLPHELKAIGIDVGLAHCATLSDGRQLDHPRFFRRDANERAKAQRRLAKEAKGTPKRHKRKRVVARLHERIANQRSDFAHQTSRRLVNPYGMLVFEDLKITGLMRKPTQGFSNKRNQSIAAGAWQQLAQFTAYKARPEGARAGRLCWQVDPRHTSKKCARCQMLLNQDLAVRVHNCPHCGLVLARDHNAAINLLALGLQGINAGGRPLAPDAVVEAPA